MNKIIPFVLIAGLAAGAVIFGLSSADAGVIEDTIENMTAEELTGPAKPPLEQTWPTLTTGLVQTIIVDLQSLAELNGYLGIARKNAVATQQVRAIKFAVEKRLQELAEAEQIP